MGKKMKIKSFTLTEVLVTLIIIGVAVALAIPTIIAHYQEQEFISKLKKLNSQLKYTHKMATETYGTADTWVDSDAINDNSQNVNTNTSFSKKFLSNLKIGRDCGIGSPERCLSYQANTQTKYLNGAAADGLYYGFNRYRVILADGTRLIIQPPTANCTAYIYGEGDGEGLNNEGACALIQADLNGNKGPNTFGKDIFLFVISKKGVDPVGLHAFKWREDKCLQPNVKGEHCAAWVIYKDNMDYLHCKDLNWFTKSICKQKN